MDKLRDELPWIIDESARVREKPDQIRKGIARMRDETVEIYRQLGHRYRYQEENEELMLMYGADMLTTCIRKYRDMDKLPSRHTRPKPSLLKPAQQLDEKSKNQIAGKKKPFLI